MLIPCERCKRHFSTREEVCPFCRHGNALSRVGAMALSAGILLAGCDAGGSKKHEEPTEKRTWGSVRGVLTSREGKPLDSATVSVTLDTNAYPGRAFSKSARTDRGGHYDFALLEPGAYTVQVQYYGTDGKTGSDQRTFTVKAGEDAKLDILLDLRDQEVAPPYGAPPARRRVV